MSENKKITFAVVGDDEMRKLNRRYLKRSGTTDVLAFPIDELNGDGVFLLGEVVVNAEQACRQAAEYGVSEKEELARLFTHGVLHLLGWDDADAVKRSRMKQMEDTILKKISTKRKGVTSHRR